MCRYLHVICAAALIAALALFSGCTDVREANEIAPALGSGIELDDHEEQLKLSIQFAVPEGSSEQATSIKKTTVMSSTGRTISEASRNLSLSLPLTPILTHVGTFIIGERLAQTDLGILADFLIRNPNHRETTYIFVSKGSPPEEILNTATPLEASSAIGLANILEVQENRNAIYQPVQSNQFFRNLTTSGIEPFCPIVSVIKNGDKKILKLAGTAVFKKNRMVGELNETESRAFTLMNPKGSQGGLLVVRWNKNTLLTIEVIRLKANYKAVIDKTGKLRMRVELKGEGNYYEQFGPGEILTIPNITKIENKTEQKITRDILQCIQKLQLMGCDILGWGQIYRAQYPAAWQVMKDDWPHYFAQIEPEVKVNFAIRRSYLSTQSFEYRE